ncbi:MAG: pyridoxal 5'-phosphate synthase glutaminase subunit PdxT [Candidatus Thermoplasmatota archaeon]|nr:pyridoxal 5'-phosphate synthase glutaminase subunit PdxT [Candidatus Thermoplasmatota archaeon]MEE2625442.1 pyridoxal 5'-phosphate synthase glutaminase subunit PdxT [Candidatus Thermoplasmatota archaeon]
MLRIGLVMLQGDRHAHMAALERASAESGIEIEVHELRKASDLHSADPHAIVIPGGESTTMRLTGNDPTSALLPALFEWIRADPSKPVLGTCAGAILLSEPEDGGPPIVDASIDRNAFGTQTASFQSTLEATALQRDFPGVFIRAPRFTDTGPEGKVAAILGDEVVGVRTGNRMALTFHPELSSDSGFHQWLIEKASAITMGV